MIRCVNFYDEKKNIINLKRQKEKKATTTTRLKAIIHFTFHLVRFIVALCDEIVYCVTHKKPYRTKKIEQLYFEWSPQSCISHERMNGSIFKQNEFNGMRISGKNNLNEYGAYFAWSVTIKMTTTIVIIMSATVKATASSSQTTARSNSSNNKNTHLIFPENTKKKKQKEKYYTMFCRHISGSIGYLYIEYADASMRPCACCVNTYAFSASLFCFHLIAYIRLFLVCSFDNILFGFGVSITLSVYVCVDLVRLKRFRFLSSIAGAGAAAAWHTNFVRYARFSVWLLVDVCECECEYVCTDTHISTSYFWIDTIRMPCRHIRAYMSRSCKSVYMQIA